MKLKKIAAAAASCVVAASALAVSSSATLTKMPSDGHFISDTGMWLAVVYSDGTVDTPEKEYTDYGIDLGAIASIELTITPAPDKIDYFDGSLNGAVILSTAKTDHNWNQKAFYSVNDEDEDCVAAEDKDFQFNKIDEYTYLGVCPVDDTNCVLVDEAKLVQLAVQEWTNDDNYEWTILSVELKDASGNVLLAFDKDGKASLPLIPQGGAAADTSADAASAPAAGDVDAATAGGSKDSPDTGIADVAAIAGLAVVAAGAAIVSKKRK